MDSSTTAPARPKNARYYSHALSKEDKQALAIGELNHNHKAWAPEDIISFHESRINLAHEGIEDCDRFLAARQKDLEEIRNKVKTRKKQIVPYLSQTRAASTQALMTPSLPSTLSPLPPAEIRFGVHHHRTVSAGDYFLQVPPMRRVWRRSPVTPFPSSPTSRRSVLSPLSKEVHPYVARPEVTFDSFLVPHASGKGEAFRGAENAKGLDQPGDKDGKTEDKEQRGTRLSRHLGRIPSVPMLRTRKSVAGPGGYPESPQSE